MVPAALGRFLTPPFTRCMRKAQPGRPEPRMHCPLFVFLVSPECGRYLIANCSAAVKIRWRIKLVHISDVNPDEAKIMAITTNWYIAA